MIPTLLAELSSVSSATLTLPRHTGPMVVTVGHLALIVSDGALRPLPARVAPAGTLLILPIVAAEHGTGAETAVWSIIAGATLTSAQDTLPVTGAAPGTGAGHVTTHTGCHLHCLLTGCIIVQGQEPVASIKVVAGLPRQTRPC